MRTVFKAQLKIHTRHPYILLLIGLSIHLTVIALGQVINRMSGCLVVQFYKGVNYFVAGHGWVMISVESVRLNAFILTDTKAYTKVGHWVYFP